MKHNSTISNINNHWAVSWTGDIVEQKSVLIQLQENGNQARISLSPEEAKEVAKQLLYFSNLIK